MKANDNNNLQITSSTYKLGAETRSVEPEPLDRDFLDKRPDLAKCVLEESSLAIENSKQQMREKTKSKHR